MSRQHCLIVGAGLGGVAAALSLSRAGHRVTVLERKSEPGEAGAGLQISPNGARVLQHLGLDPKLQSLVSKPEAVKFRHWQTGAVIVNSTLGTAAERRYQAPYYHLLRSDLMTVLIDAARLDANIDLIFGALVSNLDIQAARVSVEAEGKTYDGDILVGADGIHSKVREHLFQNEAPRFTGQVAWRLLIDGNQLPERLRRPAANVWWGPKKHFVHYPVRGGAMVNCVCVVEQGVWAAESWTEPGTLEALQCDFEQWHPDIQTLMTATDPAAVFKWGLFDRAPLRAWGRHRVTLLGDACHPTLPFLAQGASMALEDAAVLGRCVDQSEDASSDLRRYEALRQTRTAFVQKMSRRNASIYHASGLKALIRNRVAPFAGHRLMNQIYEFDAFAESP